MEHPEIPKEFLEKPELELCWKGLAISISEGQMTRKQAYQMIERWEADEELEAHIRKFEAE